MLYYNRIETRASKECDICHYWYFSDKLFKFQSYVCNGCHDVLTISINFSDIAIFNICRTDYPCNINGISKSDTVNVL